MWSKAEKTMPVRRRQVLDRGVQAASSDDRQAARSRRKTAFERVPEAWVSGTHARRALVLKNARPKESRRSVDILAEERRSGG